MGSGSRRHVTVQKILADNGMGARYERLLNLEERHCQNAIELSAEQVALIEKANPCFRERHIESNRPGAHLSQDTFFVGTLKGIGRVSLHAGVDTFVSYAFGFLHTSKVPGCAVSVIHNDVLLFYRDRALDGPGTPHGQRYRVLWLRFTSLRTLSRPQRDRTPTHEGTISLTNSFVERFNRTVLDEFFRTAFREIFYESVDALQRDLDR